MKCPLCRSGSAVVSERASNDTLRITCETCGASVFTMTAYAQLASLTADDRELLSKYCQEHSEDESPITHVRLGEVLERMSAERAATLIKKELNRKK